MELVQESSLFVVTLEFLATSIFEKEKLMWTSIIENEVGLKFTQFPEDGSLKLSGFIDLRSKRPIESNLVSTPKVISGGSSPDIETSSNLAG